MLVLLNANVIDGISADVQEGVSIICEGERIVDMTRKPPAANDQVTLDCKGRYVLPGLIDAHVHLGGVDHVPGQHRRYSSAYLAFRAAERLRIMLDAGFTTVRDAGGADPGFKRAVEEGLIPGPRLLLSLRPLTQTGGHGDERSPSEPGDYYYEGEFGMTHVIADGVDGVRQATREELRRRADVIKVIASGGAVSFGSIDRTEYSVEELSVIVAEARAVSRYVMAHALSPVAIRNCIEAEVRSVEHGNFLDEETAKLMAERGIYLVPTLLAYEHDAEFGERYGYSKEVCEKLAIGAAHGREALARAQAAGVSIGSGSDMIGPAVALMGQELAAQGEVTGAHEALMSATRVNAELCGVEEQTGTIEIGKLADLIVVDSNPLDDLTMLGSRDGINTVIKGGSVFRSSLIKETGS